MGSCGAPYNSTRYSLPVGPTFTYDVLPGTGIPIRWRVGPATPDNVHVTQIIFFDPTLTYMGVLNDPTCGGGSISTSFTVPGCTVNITGNLDPNSNATAVLN